MANLSRKTHPVKAVGNIRTPEMQASRLPVDKARGIDFNTRESISRQQFHRWRRSKESVCFTAVNDEPDATLLLHEEDAEHTGGSKGECSEANHHRLTDKTGIGSRTAQQSRIVVASRFSSDFLNYSGHLQW